MTGTREFDINIFFGSQSLKKTEAVKETEGGSLFKKKVSSDLLIGSPGGRSR